MRNIFVFLILFTLINSRAQEICDLIIIGSGLAGTSAAIEAAETTTNQKICVFEMEASYGGNSMKSSSGMNAVLTPI